MRDLYLDANECLTLGHQARKIIVGYPYKCGENTLRASSGRILHNASYSSPSSYKTVKLEVRGVT